MTSERRGRTLPLRLARGLLAAAAAGFAALLALRLVGGAHLPCPGPSVLAFTPYAAPAALVLAGCAAALRGWISTAVLTVVGIAVVVIVFPRTRPQDQPVVPAGEGRAVRVMTANLLLGKADPVALAKVVRQRRPDVLALQEASPDYVRRLRAAGLDGLVPRQVVNVGGARHDTAVLSRWPIRRIAVGGLPSVFLATRIELPGARPLTFVSAHPTPPVSPSGQKRWRGWLATLPGPRTGPLAGAIVAGDFNATLDHAEFRALLRLGWRDSAREHGSGLAFTWRGGRIPGLSLDHVLLPPGAALRGYAVEDMRGSDHRIVNSAVTLPASPGAGTTDADG